MEGISTPSRTRFRALAASAVAAIAGCNEPYNAVQRELAAMHGAGDYAAAAAYLDNPANRAAFGEKSQLLAWLDRGAVALALDDTDTATDRLEKAESFMEVRRDPTAGDEISKWLVNDAAATYYGEPYEELYVNVLKLAARLERGEIDGGATVEARRLASKADVLRDRYLRQLEAVNEKGSREVAGFAAPTLAERKMAGSTSGGNFIESTLGLYLSAVAFLKSGDLDLQEVAARRLGTAIEAQRGLVGPVKPEEFARLGELRSAEANVLFVAFSGRGPTKVARRFGPIPIYTYTVYFELPELEGGSAEADSVRVVFESGPAGTAAGRPPIELSLIEDMRSVAMANHEAQLPLIYARAFLRSSLKAAAVTIGTEAARRGTSKKESAQAAVEIIGIIGGLLYLTQTEKADLRCWTFLPGQAHVGLASLPPGEHSVRFEYLRGGRLLYATPARTMLVGAGPKDLATLVEHYWK